MVVVVSVNILLRAVRGNGKNIHEKSSTSLFHSDDVSPFIYL